MSDHGIPPLTGVNGTLMARKINNGPGMIKAQGRIIILAWDFVVERVTRIELALSAWEADVLPLNYTRETAGRAA